MRTNFTPRWCENTGPPWAMVCARFLLSLGITEACVLNRLLDVARYVGGVLALLLSALLSAVALWPCVMLFREIAAHSDMTWAVLSVPFLYLVWGGTFLLITVAFKHALFYAPHEGAWGLFTPSVVKWALTGSLQNFANTMFLVHLRGSALLNLYFRLMGVRLGHRVTINTIHIYDWDLITIDDDVIIGGDAIIQGHLLENGQMHMRPVHIHQGAQVGAHARVMPGCTIEAGGVLGAASLMTKGAVVHKDAVFAGTPARFIKMRGGAAVVSPS